MGFCGGGLDGAYFRKKFRVCKSVLFYGKAVDLARGLAVPVGNL